MGNPHLVLFLDQDPSLVHVGHIGPALERHELFPEHTHERGVRPSSRPRWIDRRSGLGAGEAVRRWPAAAAHAPRPSRRTKRGLAPAETVVRFPGGDLEVTRRDDGEVLLSGAAARVFEGVVRLEALGDR